MNSAMRLIDPLCLCDSQVMANLIAAGDDYNDDQVWAVCNLSVCLSSISSFVILVININVYSLGKLRSVSYRSMTIKATFWEEDAKEYFLWVEQILQIVQLSNMSEFLSVCLSVWILNAFLFVFCVPIKRQRARQWRRSSSSVDGHCSRKFIWLFIWNFYFILLLLA